MAYIDVNNWTPEHVVSYIRGLHPSLEKLPKTQFIRMKVNGMRFMLLEAQDLVELVPGIKVDALYKAVRGIQLMRYINHKSNKETLQSLTLDLACQARYLYNQLVQAEISPRLLPVSEPSMTPMTGTGKNRFDFVKVNSNMQLNQSTKQRVSLETLDNVSIIVEQISRIVCWLNSMRSSPEEPKFNKDFKSIVLRVAVELTSTAQRDQFVDQPNDIIKKTSKFLADYCEWVVLAITDPDFIEPCRFDVVSVKRKLGEEDFGIVMENQVLDSIIVVDVVFSSPAHRSGRISMGDEIVQIDYQTVIGWPIEKVKDIINKYRSELILTIKKRPSQLALNPHVTVLKAYPIPSKRILSQNSESMSVTQDDKMSDKQSDIEDVMESESVQMDSDEILEPPKEPKGPVYELQSTKSRRELKRRVSISGSIPDALVDLSLADSLPIPSLERQSSQTSKGMLEKSARATKEALTKSVSHDTAKLYLHTLSIDRKHLWQSQTSKEKDAI